jgi:hypothetical protein
MRKKPFKLTKDSFAKMCARADIKPVHREAYRSYDILIGDGRVINPGAVLGRFGIEQSDFPLGCFCTVWCIAKDDKIALAGVLPNKLTHDIHYDENSKRMARVAAGVVMARKHIDGLRHYASHGTH